MRKLELGQVAAILANFGVIGGIIFLAIEVSQNNRLLEAEAVASLSEMRIARSLGVATH